VPRNPRGTKEKTSADAADFADKENEVSFRFTSGGPLDALQIIFSFLCVICEICGYLFSEIFAGRELSSNDHASSTASSQCS
jgi:hypothetical protein